MKDNIYYCDICDKEYKFVFVKKKEIFHVDKEETMEFEVEELCCPVCGNGYIIKPKFDEITDILAERRREKGIVITNGKWKY